MPSEYMDSFSYISNAHPDYLENLYKDYQKDPNSVDEEFSKFFAGFDFAMANFAESGLSGTISLDELKVFRLIKDYRNKGHLVAKTNPIRERRDRHANLKLEHFGLSEKDLDREFLGGHEINIGTATLREIIDHLEKSYCRTIGFEYNYIRDEEEKKWIRTKIEQNPQLVDFPNEKKSRILQKLNKAVVFEQFLGKKYIGDKRFSLEGGETAIPAMDAMINTVAEHGADEVVIGMAHRGRLNILANILGKTYDEIFSEFEGIDLDDESKGDGDGDVKYHLGWHSQYNTDSGKEIYLKLSPNPSHLEAVDPVVLGLVRGKSETLYDGDVKRICPILIHGDAAVAGQGIVYEIAQMSQLEGYATGGTIHFVINNQIGFTTDFHDARSTDYCTSLASMYNAPVIHVNGDDIEEVIYAAEVAAEYRQTFGKDIYVDMVCYRKHGHNESDDPKYTQPQMYSLIAKHKNPRDIYISKLVSNGTITAERAKELENDLRNEMQMRLDHIRENEPTPTPQLTEINWKKIRNSEAGDFEQSPDTGVGKANIKKVVDALVHVPEGFSPLRKINKYLENRREVMNNDKSVDWAAGELLAYGTLMLEGSDVRMSGQDVKRGTFSHRHAVIFDEKTGDEHNRLNSLSGKNTGRFKIFNSLLSEYGVLGFEYGYSMANPQSLVIWEAQFGDFANNCQTVIDQFISSGESKWNRCSGLVMLLPHGYEGMGPEHSSARMERFLQLCAEYNMVVANITTPANFFHAIRRQLHWPFRKPLVVMSPKSLLRHPRCQSPIDELFSGGFQEVIVDHESAASKVKRLLFCSGKIYYELLERKEELERKDVVIVRLEQVYPLAFKQVDAILAKYKNAETFWVQEEPSNMGAWQYLLAYTLGKYNFQLVARKSSASPATGYKKQHLKEQEDILKRAFG